MFSNLLCTLEFFVFVCNLNSYKDYTHYHQNINSLIIEYIQHKKFNVGNVSYTNELSEFCNFVKTYNSDIIDIGMK